MTWLDSFDGSLPLLFVIVIGFLLSGLLIMIFWNIWRGK